MRIILLIHKNKGTYNLILIISKLIFRHNNFKMILVDILTYKFI